MILFPGPAGILIKDLIQAEGPVTTQDLIHFLSQQIA